MRRLGWVLMVLAVACGSAPTAAPTLPPPRISTTVAGTAIPPAPPTVTAQPPASTGLPAPTPAEPVKLTFKAADGVTLAAAYYAPAIRPQAGAGSTPGVLLVPMFGRPRTDWDAFARELQKYGIAALAMDLRGQGESGGPSDWGKAPGDVRAAWTALTAQPEVDAKDTALVGASIGANLALIVGANLPQVKTVIALSPGLDYQGVQPAAVLANLGSRPIYLIASQDDGYAFDSVKQMAAAYAQSETYYFKTAGHGNAMFSDPALQPLLIQWLTQKLGVLKG